MIRPAIVITIILSAVFAGIFQKIKESGTQQLTEFFRVTEKYKLIIGIISARQNFANREVIRSTWLKALTTHRFSNEVKYLFIVADKDCDIPLAYRKSEFSCKEQSTWSKGIEVYKANLTLHHGTTIFNQDFGTVGFDLFVIFDVIITGFMINSDGAQVQLWDLASEALVVESKFQNLSGTSTKQQNIPHYLLPKGFVGSLIVFCGGHACTGSKSWTQHYKNHPGIEISPMLRYSNSQSGFPEKIQLVDLDDLALPAYIINKFADEMKLEKHNINKAEAFLKRKLENEKVEKQLEKELLDHHDILFVSDVGGEKLDEVYRNLPKKVIGFHHSCVTNFKFDYLMKTDDDSYVDVERVLEKIAALEGDKENLWLGHFRYDWDVDRWGKWSEFEYTADVYPAFACGSGSVMSTKLSHFLSMNRKQLQYYQGEDVSAGIWFSAIDVYRIQDNDWICDNSCSPSMAVSTEHTVNEMKWLWENKIECGNPCGCLD